MAKNLARLFVLMLPIASSLGQAACARDPVGANDADTDADIEAADADIEAVDADRDGSHPDADADPEALADADVAPPDADPDLADAETGSPGCVVDDGGSCRAVTNDDVVVIVERDGVHMPGAGFVLDDGSFVAAVSAYDAGQILIARSADLRDFSEPQAIDDSPVSDCTGASIGGRHYLYFVAWPGGMARSEVTDAGEGPSEGVTIAGTAVTPYWPQAVGTARGVLMGFVESQTSAWLAASDDGVSFVASEAPVGTDNMRGVLVHVGRTAGGESVFTHQHADESWYFTSLVQWQDGGATWSEPIVVDDGADNVHDAFPVARLDSGADIYFLKAGPLFELNVFRRYLGERGELGPVQSVTDADVGHVEKPQARRLRDGRIALMFAMRRTMERYDIGFAVLDGDAPRE
jgi:hypothetical protein